MNLVPGESFGRVRIGQTEAELNELGLPVKKGFASDSEAFVDVGLLHTHLCDGRVVEAWIDDLRLAPACVSLRERPIRNDLPRPQVLKLFKACIRAPERKGGAFEECEDGGARIGFGMGAFIQMRVGKKGTRLDDSCEMILDDGKPAALSRSDRTELVQEVLNLRELAPFWHPDLPGRIPLRILANTALGEVDGLRLSGEALKPVPAPPKDKGGHFEITAFKSSATRVRIDFRFPAEGVVGSARFVKNFDRWTLTEHQVSER